MKYVLLPLILVAGCATNPVTVDGVCQGVVWDADDYIGCIVEYDGAYLVAMLGGPSKPPSDEPYLESKGMPFKCRITFDIACPPKATGKHIWPPESWRLFARDYATAELDAVVTHFEAHPLDPSQENQPQPLIGSYDFRFWVVEKHPTIPIENLGERD